MNYQKIYNQLIQYRKHYPAKFLGVYSETHHIIPRSIKPELEKDKTNLVSLTAREHFIVHLLLVKIYQNNNEQQNYRKMLYAFNLMCSKNIKKKEYNNLNIKINSKLYELFRIKAANELSLYLKKYFQSQNNKPYKQKNGMYNKMWITNQTTHENKVILNTQHIPEGWKKGKSISQQQRKRSILQLNKNNKIKKKWIRNKTLGICKLIPVDQQIPENWEPGSIVHFSQDGMKKLKLQFKLSQQKIDEHIKFLSPIYNEFLELKKQIPAGKAYKILKQKYKSPYSYHNFLWKCKKYLTNYIPRQKFTK